MAKYHVETTGGTYEVETEESPAPGVISTMAAQASRAVGTAASDIASIPGAAYGAIRHPIDTATNAFKATSDAVGRTREAFGKGNYGEAAKSALGAVPVVGPAAETIARDATEGRIPEAVGHIGAAYLASKAPGLVRKAPAMADAAMERVPQGFGINPDVRAGATKMAAGAAAAEVLPGPLKWPARSMGIYSGARQMGRGILKPDAAAQEAVGELPTIKPPVAETSGMVKPPAVFGDPEGFAKLPQNVQDAIMRGESPASAAPKPSVPYTPRTMESYGVTPTIGTPRPSAPTISVPAAGAADVVERVEHPPFAKDRPFPTSQKIREQTPAPTTPDRADYEARVQRLKGAFPHETDQQIRARADRAIIDKKLNAAGLRKQDFQSLGGN